MRETIASYMARLLAHAGIKRIWGITGDSLNGLSDSLQKQGLIEWMGTRHEESAAFAAGAEAQLSGQLAVCAGSCGPGNLHLINGLFDCQRNHLPVLAIASHIPSSEIGSGYFQETHPQELFKECSVYCELISNPEQMPYVLETAMRQAILKKGVSVIVISGDIMLQMMPESARISWQTPQYPNVIPTDDDSQRMASVLNASTKTVFLCGAGCHNAHDEVIRLAEVLKAPIVNALRGKDVIEHDNPYSVGMTGLIGYSSGYYAMEEADTLLILGSGFPYKPFYPKNATVIQVDINAEALGAHTQLSLGVLGDVKATIQRLLPHLQTHGDDTFLQKALKHYQNVRKDLDALATQGSSKEIIHPQYLTKLISDNATSDAIFTCDVGTPTLWAARYLTMNGKRKLLGSFSHGSMANAMPQAIGAQGLERDKQVIALCGDGGFSMLMGDILTIRQLKLKTKIVIYNNRSYGFVALEMKAGGYLYDNTDLENVNFAALAESLGIKGIRVEDPTQLEASVKTFLAHDGPALLDVVTAKHELAMPPKITLEHAKGFGLYMIRAILNGRGDQVVELAKDNVIR